MPQNTTENMPIPIKLYLNSRLLPVVDSVKHLGHVINSKLNDLSDVEAQRANFIGQVNFVLANFKSLKYPYLFKLFEC